LKSVTLFLVALLCLIFALPLATVAVQVPKVVVFNDDGGWCWFQDQRALVVQGKLVIGSVASGAHDTARRGNIEVTTYDLSSGQKQLAILHPKLSDGANGEYDDHNAPAFLVRPDGRLLAVYCRHDLDNHFYYRISSPPGNFSEWQAERIFTPVTSDHLTSHLTYSNLVRLSAENGGRGRIYDFFRGLNGFDKPSYAWSDDEGETWKTGNVFIDVPTHFQHRPYVKYISNGVDTVHIFYTDGHPNEFKWNSNYHIFYRGGALFDSKASRIAPLAAGLRRPQQGTRIFSGDSSDIAWTSDIKLDRAGRPYVAYSVRKLSPGKAACGDHRYHYARWDGNKWIDHEIAYAGSCLYNGELDYTGNIALDPGDPNTVYISTNASPKSGTPLRSKVDSKRHYEIFKGITPDGGASWNWTPITADSTEDNLRPLVPEGANGRLVLLWLRGTYRAYIDYSLAVVGIIGTRETPAH
jgi:hypothetical protein